jgi:hypothetical protein
MKKYAGYLLVLSSCLACHGEISGQKDSTRNVDANRLKLEFEPGLYFNNGRSLNIYYNVTKSNKFGIGVYLMTTEIPKDLKKNMFNGLSDSSTVKVTQEYALNLRFRLKISKTSESNPYIGLLLGWENIRLLTSTRKDMNIETFLLTPHIGYEIYIYKKMVYINPQVRSAFYISPHKSDAKRSETLKTFLIVPSIFLGIRI